MSTSGTQGDLDEWFVVIDETFENPEDQPDEDPVLVGTQEILVRRVREMIPVWRSLGITDDDTYAGFQPGRLWVGIDIDDDEAGASIGFVRVDVTDSSWTGAWVSPSRGTQPRLEDAYPEEQTRGPIVDAAVGVDQAVGWLEAQLWRPVRRHIWRDRGRVVARSWRLDDTGRELVVSGAPQLRQDTSTADSTVLQR
jgi:hypothetical protein